MSRTAKPPWWLKYALGGGAALGVLIYAVHRARAATRPKAVPQRLTKIWDFGPPLANPYVTSGWGASRDYRGGVHRGMDFRASTGTPIFAIGSGTVILTSTSQTTYGGIILGIEHESGLVSLYMHLSKILVNKGDRVKKGQIVALAGGTGKKGTERATFSPHLHFAIRIRPEFLPLYERAYGQPEGGYGKTYSTGVAVPAEPLIPTQYRESVITSARNKRIALYGERPPPTYIESAGQRILV